MRYLGVTSLIVCCSGWAQAPAGPVISPRGVTNAFTQQPAPAEVGQGGILQINGLNLGPDGGLTASGAPLPTQLGDVQVLLNGNPIPLFSVAPNQIQAQIPVDATTGLGEVMVQRASGTSHIGRITINALDPSVRTAAGTGFGQPWGSLSGQTFAMSAASLGAASPPLASGAVGSADTPSMPKAAITAFVGGIRTTATAAASTTRPGEYDVTLNVPAAAQPGDLINLIVGNTQANDTVFQSLANPTVAYQALPSGTAAITDLADTQMDGNYLIGTAARDSQGCYAGVIADMVKNAITPLATCLTSATSTASPLVRGWDALAALVGPPPSDATSGVSGTVQIFSPARDPISVKLSSSAGFLASSGGNFLATLPGGTPQAVMIDSQTGTLATNNLGGGAGGFGVGAGAGAGGFAGTAGGLAALGSVNVDGLTHALARSVGGGQGQTVVAGDDADHPTKAEIALLKNNGDVVWSQKFPDGWLPVLAPQASLPAGTGSGTGGGNTTAPAFTAPRGSLLVDSPTGVAYVPVRSGDGSKEALAAFPGDGSAPTVIALPSGWFATSCTATINFFSLELSRTAVLLGSNTADTEIKTPCPAQGFLQLDLIQHTLAAVPLSGQGQFSAGTAQSVSDYIYATDANQSGTATTVYVLDGASNGLFSMAAPSGINGFSGLRSVTEMNSLVATATNTTAGDQGLLVFNLDQQTTTVLSVPNGFSTLGEVGAFPATRKFVARAFTAQNAGSQLVVYDLVNTDNVTVVPNPNGVASVGPLPAAATGGAGGTGGFPGGGFPGGGFPGGGGGGFGGGGTGGGIVFTGGNAAGSSRLLQTNTSANTVAAVALDSNSNQVGIMVLRVP